MSVETVQKDDAVAADGAIRPFTVNVPDADLVDLRNRVRATRLPEKETVADQSQGVQLELELFAGEVRAAFRSLR